MKHVCYILCVSKKKRGNKANNNKWGCKLAAVGHKNEWVDKEHERLSQLQQDWYSGVLAIEISHFFSEMRLSKFQTIMPKIMLDQITVVYS